jgi:hypothetical protein
MQTDEAFKRLQELAAHMEPGLRELFIGGDSWLVVRHKIAALTALRRAYFVRAVERASRVNADDWEFWAAVLLAMLGKTEKGQSGKN